MRGIHRQLDLYVLRKYAFLYVGNLACFSLVYVVIDLFENLEDFDKQSETVGELARVAARYYGAVVPAVFCQLLGPVVALTAGLFTVTLLHRSNELVPMLANGLPFWRVVSPILVGGACASMATFAVQELWIPRTADAIKEALGSKEGREIIRHLTYHDDKRGVLIRIKAYHVVERRAEGVMVFSIPKHVKRAPDENEIFLAADHMEWIVPELGDGGGFWRLRQCQIQRYQYDPSRDFFTLRPPSLETLEGVAPVLYEWQAEYDLETTLIPEDIEGQKEDVVYMRLEDLERKVENSMDQSWSVKYFSRFAAPWTALVLLFVGLPLIDYFGSRNVFFGGLLAALVSCAYLVSSSVLTNLALRGFLPAGIGVFGAPAAFSALGVTWLRYLRN